MSLTPRFGTLVAIMGIARFLRAPWLLRAWLAASLLLGLLAILAPHAFAQQQSEAGARLWIEPQVPENWAFMVREAMAAQFAGANVSLRIESAPPPGERAVVVSKGKTKGLLAVFVFDAKSQNQSTLTIIDVQHDRSLVRSLQGDATTHSAMAEAAALIARDAAMALAQGVVLPEAPESATANSQAKADAVAQNSMHGAEASPIGSEIAGPPPATVSTESANTPPQVGQPTEEAAAEPASKGEAQTRATPQEPSPRAATTAEKSASPSAPQASQTRLFQLQLGYQLAYAASQFSASHAAALRADYRGLAPFVVAVQGAFTAVDKARVDSASIVVRRVPVALLAGVAFDSSRTSLSLLGGLGVETWQRTTRSGSDFTPNPDSTRARFAAVVQVQEQVRLLGPLGAFVSLEGHFFLNNFRYVADMPQRNIVSPSWVSPRLTVGLFAQL